MSHIGRCKTRLGLLDEAIALHEQAIRLDPIGPNIAIYYLRIGSARLLQSRAREAITWLEKARAANPQHPWVRAHLTAAYALDGQTDRAVAELAEARRLGGGGFLPSIARARANSTIMDGSAIRALTEATYFAGLRKAGVPEE
jgi:tetratricopeptide (TPR) repeat protein